jgi:two-component system sensor histidine kinase CpxA
MPRRFPLSAKILLWFVLNLILLGLLLYALLLAQFGFGQDWLLSSMANDRIDAVSESILLDLGQEPGTDWSATIKSFDNAYQNHAHFLVFGGDGAQLAGASLSLPEDIRRRLPRGRGPFPHGGYAQRPEGPPEGRFEGRPDRPPPGPPRDWRPKFMIHTTDPSRYWVIVPAFVRKTGQLRPDPTTLVIVSDSLFAGGLFIDVTPWLTSAAAALLLSVLLWFPLIQGINRSIAQMTEATRQIAAGRFETRVDERRHDELGTLGRAINQMAARLAGLVAGQKRFLGDVAHELCSPLAKLRVSLAILDQRTAPEQKTYLASAEDEAAHMAGLVNELLSFSKASLGAPAAPLRPVSLREAVDKALRREASETVALQVEVPPDLLVMAEPELLARALANLLRNAIRYAGQAGPITVSAQRDQDQVRLLVSDHGPGVPPGDLARLFDPFYRVDASRDRATGGAGLGLAIVKTCVEACGGSVACRNRTPSGLEVALRLQAPERGKAGPPGERPQSNLPA